MGQLILSQVVQALRDAGIPAERGYPARKMAAVTEPVAAVSLKEATIRDQALTALVTILAPAELDGAVCEEKALEAAQVITELGGSCTLGGCRFDGRTGLFSVEISSRFQTEFPVVKLEDEYLKHVEAFTCWRTVDEDAGITELKDASWNFRLEEFFPVEEEEEEKPEEPFLMTFINASGSETFFNCRWTYLRRVWSATGIRQIRLGTAEYMEIG